MSKPITSKLPAFIQQIKSLPVTKLAKLDAILSDLSNHIYEIGEYISELENGMEDFDTKKRKKTLSEIITIQKQLVCIFKLLIEIEYESHYMDRTQHTLGFVSKDLKKLISEVEKE